MLCWSDVLFVSNIVTYAPPMCVSVCVCVCVCVCVYMGECGGVHITQCRAVPYISVVMI